MRYVEEQIIHAYIDGVPIKVIEEAFQVTRASVYYYLRKNKIKRNRRKKMDEAVVRDVLEKYNNGVPLKTICEKYGKRCDMVIYRRQKGDRLIHLTDEQKKIIEVNKGKMLQKDIAKLLGVSEATIGFHINGRSHKK